MGPDGGGGLELPAVAVVVGDAYGGGGDAQVRQEVGSMCLVAMAELER